MIAVETLPAKQKTLIGIGASIVAGCQPCTLSFLAAAREADACERSIRLAIESGIARREDATAEMSAFARESLTGPKVDAAFRAERALLEALIGVAAAIANNTAFLVKERVHDARALGATDDQIRIAAEIARIAKRHAEGATDSALTAELGGAGKGADGAKGPAEPGADCGCGCSGKPANDESEAACKQGKGNSCFAGGPAEGSAEGRSIGRRCC